MDPEIVKLRNNLNTFTLEELKKEVIKMKHLNFAVTRMKRNQVIQLIIKSVCPQNSNIVRHTFKF